MALGIVCGAAATTNNANEFELILSKSSLSLQAYETDTFTITTPSDGQLFVLSSDTNIVKVSLDDNVVHVQAIEYGIATITCWQEATGNYPSPKVYRAYALLKCQALLLVVHLKLQHGKTLV